MKTRKNEKGVSLITLVITIVVIIILALIGFTASTKPVDEAALARFSQEITDIKKEVDARKVFNSRTGLDEDTLNKDFKKVVVANPPSIFASFDTNEKTGYLVDLSVIDYEKIKTGREYKSFREGDTVTFDVDDVYVYDRLGNVFYLKGLHLDGGEEYYTVNEHAYGGPLVEAENTEGLTVAVHVTPIKGGEITMVTVDGKEANKIATGEYEIEMEKNGTYLVVATEEDSGSSKTTVKVTKGPDDGTFFGEEGVAPTQGSIVINGGEPYTTDRRATLNIQTNAQQMNIKYSTTGVIPVTPSSTDSDWRISASSQAFSLTEGLNEVFAWFRNTGNSTILNDSASVILDTTPPTDTAPTVLIFNEHSFRITCNQIDPGVGSGLKEIKIGYKKENGPDYIWTTVSDVNNPTIEIRDNEPGVNYIIKTTAEDNVGFLTESKEYQTGELVQVPDDVRIDYTPTSGWTRTSTVVITYPSVSNTATYKRLYRINEGEWKKADSLRETIILDENAKVDAVVAKVAESTTYYGKIASVEITNIDSTAPEIDSTDFH